jgi:UDP-N-acetyl-2-amino-2-deoxyglucuronate dehydrogenase
MDRAVRIRVGIIGLGNIGHRFGVSPKGDPLSHSEGYALIPNVEIALGVDIDHDACKIFQSRFPKAKVYTSLLEVPKKVCLDIVSVCNPTEQHVRAVETALLWKPRVILCEKPLALHAAEAESMVAVCAFRDCILMTNYSRRWTPMMQKLKDLANQNGILDAPFGACFRYNGGLRHNGTHWIDLLMALFGPVDSAACIEAPLYGLEDPAESVLLKWKNGFAAYLISVRGTLYSIGEGEIWGLRGMVKIRESGESIVVQKGEPSQWQGFNLLGREDIVCENGLKGHILDAVTEAVHLAQTGGRPTCSGEDGLLSLQVVEMARKNRVIASGDKKNDRS